MLDDAMGFVLVPWRGRAWGVGVLELRPSARGRPVNRSIARAAQRQEGRFLIPKVERRQDTVGACPDTQSADSARLIAQHAEASDAVGSNQSACNYPRGCGTMRI
jgi:hypothetical protein